MIDTIARLIGYGVLAWFAFKVLGHILSERRATRAEALRRESDERFKLINPEGYARQMEHRLNMERLRNGVPVDPEWARDMDASVRELKSHKITG